MKLLTDTPAKRTHFFGLPRTARFGLYLPVFCVMLFFGLRTFENAITYHPVRYEPGAAWTLPADSEDVWFRADDGVKLNGWLIRARTQPTLGTVLYCHGNGGNLTSVKSLAGQLAERGLDVLIYDYRGYGRSEGSLSDEWALYRDGDAAYDFLTRERGVKPERLAIYGLSLGTTVAVDLASRRAARALVVESGLSSASELALYAAPWLPRWMHWLGRNRFESSRKLELVKCPVLIAHGTADDVIPVDHGQRLFAAAREPKKQIIIEGGTHWLPGRKDYIDSVAEFIRGALQ
jgi:hypothetical protein